MSDESAPRVALATCASLPAGDADDAPLLAALSASGIEAVWATWDDPHVAWDGFDLVVIRSTWDYIARRERFLAWAGAVPRLANPAPVLAWNSDKAYLRDLDAAGLPIVPTEFVAPGEQWPGWDARGGEFVIKPSVGAGSLGAGRFDAGRPGALDDAAAHLEALHAAGRTALIQPYLGDVDTAGETALLYFAGRFSHAIRKGPMLPVEGAPHPVDRAPEDELYVAEAITAREPSPAEHALADRAMAALEARFGRLLYARIDLLPAADGPVVIEVELTEPSLFLSHGPGAAQRCAAAIVAAIPPRG